MPRVSLRRLVLGPETWWAITSIRFRKSLFWTARAPIPLEDLLSRR